MIAVIFFIFLASFNAQALNTLSLGRGHDNLAWKLRWQRQDVKNADLCFSKAINYYAEFIENNEAGIADIETRRFTPFDAQKRIVYIYKFGLLNESLAKKEFKKLLNMYSAIGNKFRTSRLTERIKSKISQLNTEFKYKGYVVHLAKNNVLCLFLNNFSGDEILIYDELIPIARAKVIEINKINDREIIVKAEVVSQNHLKKISPFCNAEAAVNNIVNNKKRSESLAENYYNTGKSLFEKRDFESAQEYFWYALRYKPDYKEALNMLGLIYFYYQDIDNAKKLYISALEIDPSYLEAYLNLAGAYLGGSDFIIDTNNVFDMLEGSIARNPNYVRAYYWLGHAWDDFMFFERAKKYYRQGEKMIAVLPVDNWYKETSLKSKLSSPGQIYWDTANIYLDDKDPMLNSAIYAFEELLKLNPGDLNTKKRLSKILKICPFAKDNSLYKDVILHRKRGLVLAGENKIKEAIDEIRTSLYLDQVISSEFRRCIRRIPRIRID